MSYDSILKNKENKHTLEDLFFYQKLDLNMKIQLTKDRIRTWVSEYGENGVYVSFSGGKDSTVLLNIVRELYPNIEAVFVDTGLEYPEIKEFVSTFDNVTTIRPSMMFKDVLISHGYPLISKEVAGKIETARKNPNGKTAECFIGNSEYNKKYGEKYSLLEWNLLKNSDIPISSACCNIMKENPIAIFERATGKKSIIGTLAEESNLRKRMWIKNGCNGFNMKSPKSQPISFWTEQDILRYIKEKNIAIASVYGDIESYKFREHIKGGKTYEKLRTTDCSRTGCMFCAFGLHSESRELNRINKRTESPPNLIESRFERLKRTHPKLYDYCINGGEFIEKEIFINNGNYRYKNRDKDLLQSDCEIIKKQIWIPNNQGLGLGFVFEELCKLYGEKFVRW